MGVTRTISKLAKEAGISVETVRYYERLGLIDQPPKLGGPRHYDARALAMLKYIGVAKGYGLKLREISSLRGQIGSGRAFCSSFRALVETKVHEINRKQAELAALKAELAVLLERCRTRAAHLPCPVVEELKCQLTHVPTTTTGAAAPNGRGIRERRRQR